MKVALIFPNNLYTSPYLVYYTQILDREGISYDVISWNRNNRHEAQTIAYTPKKIYTLKYLKLVDYFKFIKFVKSEVSKNDYDKLIVFTCQLGIFMQGYLKRNFSGKYLLDIRDYSPLIPYFQNKITELVKHADLVPLSSKGFENWLPKSENYILSHNVNISLVLERLQSARNDREYFSNETLTIDTIGQIKDYASEQKIVSILGNDNRFSMTYIGFGISIPELKDFVKESGFKNISFTGPYKKENEHEMLVNTDFVNILISESTFNNDVLSNRLYLAALLGIPCLVNHYTREQRKIIEKFRFGIVIKDYNQIPEEVLQFKRQFKKNQFQENCTNFLKEVVEDHKAFDRKLVQFLKF